MSLTVIAGEFGGRRLACPPGKSVRPVTARVKGAVFNILGGTVPGTRVLDLYAGSGSFGIEALSRGAVSAVFVEQAPAHAGVLQANLALLRLESRARVMVQANREAFRRLAAEGLAFDLILADPPFSKDRKALPPDVFGDLEALAGSSVWAPRGVVVLEHRGGRPPFPGTLVPFSQRDYGDSTVSFFERGAGPTTPPGRSDSP